ncbi:MAG: hypothetical protein IPM79_08255 [Polyangiaceae bacterium]|nr:hypothetical protein [Polyangiaceae bacterium]
MLVDNVMIVPEEPDVVFASASPIATVSFVQGSDNAPALKLAVLSAPIGPMLRVTVRWVQGPPRPRRPRPSPSASTWWVARRDRAPTLTVAFFLRWSQGEPSAAPSDAAAAVRLASAFAVAHAART